MLIWHILGWATVIAGSLLGGFSIWFGAGGWRRFQSPILIPPPVPRLVLTAPNPDPIPGYSDFVGML